MYMFRLMLHRMKWEDDVIKTKDESEPKSNNKCSLVWEVIKKIIKTYKVTIKSCITDKFKTRFLLYFIVLNNV